MKYLFYKKIGNYNKHNLVLLHGWGLNSKVWYCIIPYLKDFFCLNVIDLPGYSKSYGYGELNLQEISELLVSRFPSNFSLMGWSLGGLIATEIAYSWPEKVNVLITVASSPKFCSDMLWPGINIEVLKNFSKDIEKNFFHTMKKFFFIQTGGLKNKLQNIKYLSNIIFKKNVLDYKSLIGELRILIMSDVRKQLQKINIPLLHIYGRYDNLIPKAVIPLIDKINKFSISCIFKHSAHIPFINENKRFCDIITSFILSKVK